MVPIVILYLILQRLQIADLKSGAVKGVVSLLDKALAPLMKPLYHLPGAGILGILTTYLSDNPAILALAQKPGYRRYSKRISSHRSPTWGTPLA